MRYLFIRCRFDCAQELPKDDPQVRLETPIAKSALTLSACSSPRTFSESTSRPEYSRRTTFWHVDQGLAAISAIGASTAGIVHSYCARLGAPGK